MGVAAGATGAAGAATWAVSPAMAILAHRASPISCISLVIFSSERVLTSAAHLPPLSSLLSVRAGCVEPGSSLPALALAVSLAGSSPVAATCRPMFRWLEEAEP